MWIAARLTTEKNESKTPPPKKNWRPYNQVQSKLAMQNRNSGIDVHSKHLWPPNLSKPLEVSEARTECAATAQETACSQEWHSTCSHPPNSSSRKKKGNSDVKQIIATANKEITLIKEFLRQESSERIMTVTGGCLNIEQWRNIWTHRPKTEFGFLWKATSTTKGMRSFLSNTRKKFTARWR